MLTVMVLSQHHALSSKTKPRAPCGARYMGHAIRTWSAVCSKALHLQFSEGARPHMELPNTSFQEIELNPNCLGQAYSNWPGTGHGYEEPGCILAVLCAPSIIHPLRSKDAKFNKVVHYIPCSWHKWVSRS